MSSLAKAGWKFLFGGQGLSLRTGRYFGESILVGAVTGVVVVGFRYLIGLAKDYIMEDLGHHR
ncbi:MAG: hypothetical protein J6P80_03560, partial [Kiritimatiellae bacterium]|nr:hypothetical protein [Kiritimatiellia bacterium]